MTARLSWVDCPWCTLRAQGCRCATSCGASGCGADHRSMPAVQDITGEQE